MVDEREKIFEMIPNIFKCFSVMPNEIGSYQSAHAISILHAASLFQFIKDLVVEAKIKILKNVD